MPKIIKLKDGAVLLYHKNNQSKATAFRVGMRRGGFLDKNTGLSHLFEHMLFKGTTNWSNEELTALIRDNFSNLNASTSGDYMIIRSYESKKKIKQALKISSDMLLNSTFDKDELEKEKQVVRQEIIRANDDIQRIASHNLNIMAYNYPVFKSKTLGDEKKMMAITQKQLLKHREYNLVRENFIASVSSNLPAHTIKKYINEYFVDHLKSGEKNTFDSCDYKINGKSGIVVETMDRQKVVMKVAIPCCGYLDMKNSFLLSRVISYISGVKGPLFVHFREKKQLVYSVGLRRTNCKYDGLLYFDIETSTDKVNDCFYAIKDFMDEVKQGIAQKDVSRLLEKYEENDDRFVGHPVDFCSGIMFDYLDYGRIIKDKEFKKFKKYITKENLDKVILDVFNPDKVFVSVAGPVAKKDIMPFSQIEKLIIG